MRSLLNNRPGSGSIFIVILFALSGYFIAHQVINRHVVQYTKLPGTFKVQLIEQPDGRPVEMSFPIVSNQADSLVHPLLNDEKIQEGNYLYHQNPAFIIWFALILIMITTASGAFPVFVVQIYRLMKDFDLNWKNLVFAILFGLFVALLLFGTIAPKGYFRPEEIIGQFRILLSDNRVVTGIVTATFVLVFLILVFMFLVGPAASKALAKLETEADVETAAGKLEQLNQLLRNALQMLTFIVVFSVLTSSTLRISIKAVFEIKQYDIFPEYASYVYGIFFSLFLGIMYIPVYQYLKQQQQQIKDRARGMVQNGTAQATDWYTKISGIMKFDGTALENIKLSLVVLSPLISSFIPKALNAFQG
jgi:hypothetical protein